MGTRQSRSPRSNRSCKIPLQRGQNIQLWILQGSEKHSGRKGSLHLRNTRHGWLNQARLPTGFDTPIKLRDKVIPKKNYFTSERNKIMEQIDRKQSQQTVQS